MMKTYHQMASEEFFEALRTAFMEGTAAEDNCIKDEADGWFKKWLIEYHPNLSHFLNN